MAKRQGEFNADTMDDLYAKIASLQNRIRLIHKTPTFVERVNPVTLPDPAEGQVAIDSRSDCLIYYANEFWREKCSAVHAMKVFGDTTANKVRDGAFRFTVEKDLDDTTVTLIEAFNGTVGSGATTAQVRNMTRGIDLLTTSVTVASGADHDNGAAVINDAGLFPLENNRVSWKDVIWINTTAVGAGSKGFGVYMTFHGPKVDLTPEL